MRGRRTLHPASCTCSHPFSTAQLARRTDTLRAHEEYYFDKLLSNTFLENTFDSNHNTFDDIRRVADVYEWGSSVFWSGLLGNAGPGCGDAGGGGVFNSAVAHSGTYVPGVRSSFKGGCNDDGWADGEGALAMHSPSGWTMEELTARYNELDWTEGVAISQSRVASQSAAHCRTRIIGGTCLPEVVDSSTEQINRSAFGYNWTHPNAPLLQPFRYLTADEAGSDPSGASSANPVSLKSYPPGGFFALVLPFLADTWIEDERGTHEHVTDIRKVAATKHNDRTPRYECVRLVWNGDWIHQLCDPNDPATGRTTGVVRAAVEEFWHDLKRAHFVDFATRALSITACFSSNNVGVRSRVSFMFEFTSSGTVLPSFDTQTRVERADQVEATKLYTWIALGFCVFFCVLEAIEMTSSGASYFADLWNLMDWLNYLCFFVVWWTLMQYFRQVSEVRCSELCQRTGYRDDWEAMNTIRDGKFYLSLCVCIQLLKIIKFVSSLIPKMGLAPNVLRKAFADLVFFGITFFLSLFAFSTMFYIQLGPFINDYATQPAAVIATFRALFGDFDMDEIMGNSAGYSNVILFILYLFVAVFIMLSMFFAILGESQANFRDDQREARSHGTLEPEYGAITESYAWLKKRVLLNTPLVGELLRVSDEKARLKGIQQEKGTAPTPVERIEARQLGLTDKIDDILEALSSVRAVQAHQQETLNGLSRLPPQHGGAERGSSRSRSVHDLRSKRVSGQCRDEHKRMQDMRTCTYSGTRERPPREHCHGGSMKKRATQTHIEAAVGQVGQVGQSESASNGRMSAQMNGRAGRARNGLNTTMAGSSSPSRAQAPAPASAMRSSARGACFTLAESEHFSA